MYWTSNPKLLQPSSSPPNVSSSRTLKHSLYESQNNLTFAVEGIGYWSFSIPESVTFRNSMLLPRDACHNQPDGTRVLATGKFLYDYMRRESLDTVSEDGDCHPIDACTGQEAGTLLMDPFDVRAYYKCEGSNQASQRHMCPPGYWFFHDSCRPTLDVTHYCKFYNQPLRINDRLLLTCQNEQPHYVTCPTGTRLFDTTRCESEACLSQPDGTVLPMPMIREGSFTFHPGYSVCKDNRVFEKHTCPKIWDSHLSKGDNLTHLPMVFDGNRCTVPVFCENVQMRYTTDIVPVHEFTKHVKNWKFSELFDSVTGYRCENGNMRSKRKRISLPPGHSINKKFKVDTACNGFEKFIPVSNRPNQYYDCTKDLVETCPAPAFFDGAQCRNPIPQAHTFNSMPLFRLEPLSQDGWIEPFNYSKLNSVEPCTDPESVYLSIFNICSHPDCTLYPFVSQMKFSIKLQNDPSECVFDETTRRLMKLPLQNRYKFWSQRLVSDTIDADDDVCVPGNKIQSGNFVIDSTVYMTCDNTQPFVFCPSAQTAGIEKVGEKYACVPIGKSMGILEANQTIQFEPNELEKLIPQPNTNPSIRLNNGPLQQVPPEGMDMVENEKLQLWTDTTLEFQYRYRVTHPPDVVLHDNRLQQSNKGGAFLMKRKDFTQKPVTMPHYTITESVSDFMEPTR
ncbi:uncharacterized protein CEXT_533431 [Caerostris extrusa]|uniref:Chitin-binding type-2 domain-containing protein n=1 Tax=Caerostris extrusa TaxID=172846 RepID=A0AAV4TAJ7_CAEEX|nr:uncharacterized protein CEXT_533431 [Caerostris extrusa]